MSTKIHYKTCGKAKLENNVNKKSFLAKNPGERDSKFMQNRAIATNVEETPLCPIFEEPKNRKALNNENEVAVVEYKEPTHFIGPLL